MAKITAVIPEPTPEYEESNQRQLREGLDTLKNELNFGYQQDLRNEETWKDVTRRETMEAAETSIDKTIEHYKKKLEFINGPKVVKTFK